MSGGEFTLEKAKKNSVVDIVHKKEDALLEDRTLSFRVMFGYVFLIRHGKLLIFVFSSTPVLWFEPQQKQLKGGRVHFSSGFKSNPFIAEKTRQQELELAGRAHPQPRSRD